MKEVKIHRWSLVCDDAFKAPEINTQRLTGRVYGHPNFKNGCRITTTKVINLSLTDKKVTTRNTTYILGTPDPKFLKFLKEYNSSWYELFKEYDREA